MSLPTRVFFGLLLLSFFLGFIFLSIWYSGISTHFYNSMNPSSLSQDKTVETYFGARAFSSNQKNKNGMDLTSNMAATEDETVYVDKSGAIDLYKKIRVFCIILTMEKDLSTKTLAVNNTWARRCNKHFFIMTTKLHRADIISSLYSDERTNLIHKVRSAFEFIHDKYMDELDWVFKADDDTYAIIENLRFLLSHYNASKPGYLGFIFDQFVTNGYMSGGAGYVISRQGIKQIVQNGIRGHKCPVLKTEDNLELSEDVEIGRCLESNQVPRLNSHDVYGRDTFHPYPVEQHLFGNLPQYLYSWCKQPPVEGRNCCSQFTISFHYMNPRSILLIDHLLYKTSIFGRTLPKQMGKVIQVGQYRP